MEVALIRYTEDPYSVLYFAGKSCARKDISFQEVAEDVPLAEKQAFIRKLIEKGHESVLEHVTFTFSIGGVSRITTHQLVRHRIASYSQYSHRRYDRTPSFVLPPSFSSLPPELLKRTKRLLWNAVDLYASLVEAGVDEEDARYLLPQALSTHIVVTFNTRSLRNFFRLRLSPQASLEIRELAARMFDLVYSVAPALFEDLLEERRRAGDGGAFLTVRGGSG